MGDKNRKKDGSNAEKAKGSRQKNLSETVASRGKSTADAGRNNESSIRSSANHASPEKKSKRLAGSTRSSSSTSSSRSSSTLQSSSQTSSSKSVNYAEFNGDLGIARFLWWALAALALLIALGLIATQCFGGSSSGNEASGQGATSETVVQSANGEATDSDGDSKSSGSSSGEVESPSAADDLSSEAEAALQDAEIEGISAIADDDQLTITGVAASEAEKINAEETVRRIPGVSSVINGITVEVNLEEDGTQSSDSTGPAVEESDNQKSELAESVNSEPTGPAVEESDNQQSELAESVNSEPTGPAVEEGNNQKPKPAEASPAEPKSAEPSFNG